VTVTTIRGLVSGEDGHDVVTVANAPATEFWAAAACAQESAVPLLPLQTEFNGTEEGAEVVPEVDKACAPANAAASAAD